MFLGGNKKESLNFDLPNPKFQTHQVNVNVMLLFPMASESVSNVNSCVCMSQCSSLPSFLSSFLFFYCFALLPKKLILIFYSELPEDISQKLWNWNLHMLLEEKGFRISSYVRKLKENQTKIIIIRTIK